MLVGSTKMCEILGEDVPYYSLMLMTKSGIIPSIRIGSGRGSKILYDPELVQAALTQHAIENQRQAQELAG